MQREGAKQEDVKSVKDLNDKVWAISRFTSGSHLMACELFTIYLSLSSFSCCSCAGETGGMGYGKLEVQDRRRHQRSAGSSH
eukprot:767176-Hanusia_phi.AAC.4